MTGITLKAVGLALEASLIRATGMEWKVEALEKSNSVVFRAQGFYVCANAACPVDDFWNGGNVDQIVSWLTRRVLEIERNAIEMSDESREQAGQFCIDCCYWSHTGIYGECGECKVGQSHLSAVQQYFAAGGNITSPGYSCIKFKPKPKSYNA